MKVLNSIIEQDDEAPETAESKKRRFFNDLTGQFAALPMAIFADVRNKRLKHRDVCLYMHVLVKQGTKRSSYWGIDSLALLTGTNKTSIKESLRRLTACGHIARYRGKNTSHTVCLTRLTPGCGFEGIRVKGKRVGELKQEASDQPIESPPCQLRATVGQPSAKATCAPITNDFRKDDAEAEKAFFKEWDENQAAVRAADQARQWAGFQSLKY